MMGKVIWLKLLTEGRSQGPFDHHAYSKYENVLVFFNIPWKTPWSLIFFDTNFVMVIIELQGFSSFIFPRMHFLFIEFQGFSSLLPLPLFLNIRNTLTFALSMYRH